MLHIQGLKAAYAATDVLRGIDLDVPAGQLLCVLGPSGHSHIVCHDWPNEVVVFRRDGELFCRAPGEMQIDGIPTRRRGRIKKDSRVEGHRFSFSLEPI